MNVWEEVAALTRLSHDHGVIWIENPALDVLAVIGPDLVLLGCDSPSPDFESSVLEKCHELKLKILPVQGRASAGENPTLDD